MSELHKAYSSLQLMPGTSFEEVKSSYRFLAYIWHPDRVDCQEKRQQAEEDLKVVNHSFSVLKEHFENDHVDGAGCACQPKKEEAPASRNYFESMSQKAEEAAKDPDVQWRRHQAAVRYMQFMSLVPNSAQSQPPLDPPLPEQQMATSKAPGTQWKPIVLILSFLVALNFLAVTKEVKLDQPPKVIAPTTPQDVQTSNAPDTPETPYSIVSPLNKNQPLSIWFHKRQKEVKEQIYFARLEVDRAKKAIDQSTQNLAQIDLKLADPSLSETERQRLIALGEFQQNVLVGAQEDLRAADSKVRALEQLTSAIFVPSTAPLPAILQNGL